MSENFFTRYKNIGKIVKNQKINYEINNDDMGNTILYYEYLIKILFY